jgi:hypothetical protein
MPTDVWFWVFIAVLIAAVVAYAIWKNRGMSIEFGTKGVKVGTQASPGAPPSGITKVAEGMKLEKNVKVGSIVGNESRSDAFPANQITEVGKQMVVGENSAIEKIVGNRIVGPNEPRR